MIMITGAGAIIVFYKYKYYNKINLIRYYKITHNTPWLVNLPRRLILDQNQKVQCLVTTDIILSNRNTYLNLFSCLP